MLQVGYSSLLHIVEMHEIIFLEFEKEKEKRKRTCKKNTKEKFGNNVT